MKRTLRFWALGLSLAAAPVLVGCGDDTGGTGGTGGSPGNTFGAVNAIFMGKCAVCHPNGASNPANNNLPHAMDLSAGAAFNSIVGVPALEKPGTMTVLRVDPGHPDTSYLLCKVDALCTRLIAGNHMPLTTSGLEQTDVATIRNWIMAGAPNN